MRHCNMSLSDLAHNAPMSYYQQALELAAHSLTLSNPNPRVGCVIVDADGRTLGQGYTQQRGGPHAEIMALRDAASRGEDVVGSTVYVTLEPCAHHGRTPPCCDALIAARVAKVCIALRDPNPQVAGQGIARLQAAGIAVEMAPPEIEAQAREINIGFLRRMEHGVPWVRLKTASSLDGMTALGNGDSQWITGETARADVQHWRARACAVLTGSGTVVADDPLLNVRLPGATRQPHLVIVLRAAERRAREQLLEPTQQHALGDEIGQPGQQQQPGQNGQAVGPGIGRERVAELLELDLHGNAVSLALRSAADHDQAGRLRSMVTPTARAPRTAPGLLSFKRTEATLNSSITIAAQRSASVSTRPKSEAETYSIRRLLTAL